jgi:hypothetical protein
MESAVFHRTLVLVVSFVLWAAPASVRAAQSETDVIQKLARAGGPERYPGANVLFVEKRRDIRYEVNGAYVDRTYLLIKFLTQPAVTYLSTMPALEYYSYRSEGQVLFARVLKAGGQVFDVPPANITDIVNPMYAALNVKDNTMRLKQITFENLQVGDAVEFAVEERCNRPVTSDFELKEGKYLQEDEPVLYARIEINGPNKRPLRHVVKCAERLAVRYRSEKEGERVSYLWEASGIPAFASEPGWDTRQHFAARLLASTVASWKDVSRSEYRLSRASMDQNDQLRAVVAGITRGLRDDDEKASAIQAFLRKNIKYQGTTSISAYQSKAATQTLAERFGVCRDVAVLMCSMLQAAGIRSFPAATGYNRVFDYEIPHDIFQHMIVAVPRPGGGYRLYDPTSTLYAGDRLPGYAGHAPLLVCTPDGEDLTRIPHIPAAENMGNIRAESQLSAGGTLSSTVTITGSGFYDEDLRNWRKRTKQEEYAKRWQSIVALLHPAAKVSGLSTSDPEDLVTPFQVILSYEVPGYALPSGESLSIRVPLASDHFERVLADIVAKANHQERRYPLIVTTAIGVQTREAIALPSGYAMKTIPEPVDLQSKDLNLMIRYAVAVGSGSSPALEFTKRFVIDSRQFEGESYLDLRKVLDANFRSRSAEITLAIPNR